MKMVNHSASLLLQLMNVKNTNYNPYARFSFATNREINKKTAEITPDDLLLEQNDHYPLAS
jgi:hypothetical protein